MSDADRTTALADRLAAAARAASGESDDPARSRGGDGDRGAGTPRAVEVGIGERTAVAAALAERGVAVTATDVVDRAVPDGVGFVRDDVTDPDPGVYRDAALVYALRLPPELHRAFAAVVRTAARGGSESPTDGPAAAFTTLGGDPPAVPATPEQLPGGETLYWVAQPG